MNTSGEYLCHRRSSVVYTRHHVSSSRYRFILKNRERTHSELYCLRYDQWCLRRFVNGFCWNKICARVQPDGYLYAYHVWVCGVFVGRYNWMFCIINLRHNSRYVASPAAGGPPSFTTPRIERSDPPIRSRRRLTSWGYLYIHGHACPRSETSLLNWYLYRSEKRVAVFLKLRAAMTCIPRRHSQW